MIYVLPTGKMTKNGNQQSKKAPTTIPSVLAAFFWRRNLNIFADKPVLVDVVAEAVGVDDVLAPPIDDGRLEPLRCCPWWCTLPVKWDEAPKFFFIIAPVASSRSLASSLSSGGEANGCWDVCDCLDSLLFFLDDRSQLLLLLVESNDERPAVLDRPLTTWWWLVVLLWPTAATTGFIGVARPTWTLNVNTSLLNDDVDLSVFVPLSKNLVCLTAAR